MFFQGKTICQGKASDTHVLKERLLLSLGFYIRILVLQNTEFVFPEVAHLLL